MPHRSRLLGFDRFEDLLSVLGGIDLVVLQGDLPSLSMTGPRPRSGQGHVPRRPWPEVAAFVDGRRTSATEPSSSASSVKLFLDGLEDLMVGVSPLTPTTSTFCLGSCRRGSRRPACAAAKSAGRSRRRRSSADVTVDQGLPDRRRWNTGASPLSRPVARSEDAAEIAGQGECSETSHGATPQMKRVVWTARRPVNNGVILGAAVAAVMKWLVRRSPWGKHSCLPRPGRREKWTKVFAHVGRISSLVRR